MTVETPGADPSDRPVEPVEYCGITFDSKSVSGRTATGEPIRVPTPEISRSVVRATTSRSRAAAKMFGAVALFGAAGVLALSAIGAVELPTDLFMNSDGVRVALIIMLGGAGARLFATARDPRHVLVLTRRGDEVSLAFSPAPEPFKMIEVTEKAKQQFGIDVELYPEV